MSRVQKFGSRRERPEAGRTARAGGSDEVGDRDRGMLPSRRVKHPSNKQQMAKWFYRILIFLFLSLMVGLFMWGRKHGDF